MSGSLLVRDHGSVLIFTFSKIDVDPAKPAFSLIVEMQACSFSLISTLI